MSRARKPLLIGLAMMLIALPASGCGDDSDDEGTSTGQGAGTFADYDITGTWGGKLTQQGLPDFRVRAQIRNLEDEFKNTVSYTGIDCSGRWAYQGREGTAFRFQEVIDAGKGGNCKGKGTVLLTPFSETGADYNFRGGGVESAGVLKRQ